MEKEETERGGSARGLQLGRRPTTLSERLPPDSLGSVGACVVCAVEYVVSRERRLERG